MAPQPDSATEQKRRLREAGARAAAGLPDLSPETCRRVAELMRESVNTYVRARPQGAA